MNKLNKAFRINPLYEADGYKVAHHEMLAENTVTEAWNWIPRSLKYMHPSITEIMSAGQQLVWRYIHSNFQEHFFGLPLEEAMQFPRDMKIYLGIDYNGTHFENLHKLGYLPLQIQSLPEGIFTSKNIPHMQGINTVDGYAWLGLYLETLVSKLAWQMPTAATIGAKFKENAKQAVLETDKNNLWLVDYMCHDFHSRGGNPFTSIAVGLGHALSNRGSDTLNVIPAARYYYDVADDDVCINSVNASEHSVTCTGIFFYERRLRKGLMNNEIKEYYSFDVVCEGSIENPDYLAIAEWLNLRRWLKKFPKSILSVVYDTFNMWKGITHILPRLKKEILERDGKLVIRGDSGDPVDIICGKKNNIIKFFNDYPDNEELEWESLSHYIYENYQHDIAGGLVEIKGEIYQIGDFKYMIEEYGWENGVSEIINSIAELKANGLIKKSEAAPINENEQKGVIELLWDVFGGTVNEQGYKVLDPHIGAIYGDSINLERQMAIYSRLKEKQFAATNVVVGIGSFTYVYITRDQAGYAAKGSWFETLEEEERIAYDIYKDPITDEGTKKSLKGLQFVYLKEDGKYYTQSEVSKEQAFSEENLLKTIYKDGKFFNQTSLVEIRKKLK